MPRRRDLFTIAEFRFFEPRGFCRCGVFKRTQTVCDLFNLSGDAFDFFAQGLELAAQRIGRGQRRCAVRRDLFNHQTRRFLPRQKPHRHQFDTRQHLFCFAAFFVDEATFEFER